MQGINGFVFSVTQFGENRGSDTELPSKSYSRIGEILLHDPVGRIRGVVQGYE